MKPTRTVSRRSFLASVGGAAVGGGALLAVAGRAGAVPVTDRDSGAGADPAGRGRGSAPIQPGDSDFASPIPMGDTFQSDPPPGRRTGLTDSDGGPAFDWASYGAGRNRREVHAARCTEVRQRIGRLEGMRPRTAEIEGRLTTLRPYLNRWRCG